MSLFGSHRDRRRRTLTDDSAAATPVVSTGAARSAVKPDRYTAAARPEQHRRLSDLLPKRGWTLSLAYLAGLTVVAGLLAGYATVGDLPEGAASIARLLDISTGDSLAGWFSSVLFAWAAAGSLLIYSIRRHKLDDYRGRYRLWLWSAAAWLVMSVDAVADLHTPFAQAMSILTDWSMPPDGSVWWIGAWATVLSILALRLTIETRECRAATVSIVAVAALWPAALVIDYGWLRVGEDAALIAAGCRLVGQVTLLLAIGAYARHVLLDAQGLLAARPAKPKRQRAESAKPTSTSDSSKTTRIDSAHRPGEPHTSGGPARPVTASSSSFTANRSASARPDEDDNRYSQYSDYEEDDLDSSGRKLSKAERKRLRKMMRRQQRDDED